MTQDKEDTKKDDEDGADDNIFDNPVLPDDKDDRPTDAEDSLSDEEKERVNDYDSRDEDIITVTLEEDYEK